VTQYRFGHHPSRTIDVRAAQAMPRGARPGMNADESVSRFIDRVLRRPHPQAAVTP
jgi:hypothetical protein